MLDLLPDLPKVIDDKPELSVLQDAETQTQLLQQDFFEDITSSNQHLISQEEFCDNKRPLVDRDDRTTQTFWRDVTVDIFNYEMEASQSKIFKKSLKPLSIEINMIDYSSSDSQFEE